MSDDLEAHRSTTDPANPSNNTKAGDKTTKFGTSSGNNDHFQIDVSGFGLGSVGMGAIDATAFCVRADGNAAGDASDRFIVRDSDDTLWFDRDGNGTAPAARLIADLQAGAVVTAEDILVV